MIKIDTPTNIKESSNAIVVDLTQVLKSIHLAFL